ncbi:MAG: hypothetical protein QM734_16645 [Cyclobacteriaceae bacterium]
MKNTCALLILLCFSACQTKKAESENTNTTVTDSTQLKSSSEASANFTGSYTYAEKSEGGFAFCEFSFEQLDKLDGNFTVTIYKDKNGNEYSNPLSSASYPLQITLTDDGYLQVQPEVTDSDTWNTAKQKFPILDKMFFSDGSGFPMQNLYKKSADIIIAQTEQSADSLVLKYSKAE